MTVQVVFEPLRNGEPVETATATDSATLTVGTEELSFTIELSGTGSWEVTTEQD